MVEAFSVLRQHRLKSASKIAAADGHNRRRIDTPNADPALANGVLVDWTAGPHPTLWAAVQARIAAADDARRAAGQKVRNRAEDAVPAFEMVLSASPEYFRPGQPDRHGHYEPEKLAAWLKATKAFLAERYGDRVVDARLHLDEATPHIQAIVVPVTADHRLSAKEVMGNAQAYAQLQTDYSKALAHLGIQRGIPKSRAKHTTIKEYYGALDAPNHAPPTVEVSSPPVFSREKWALAESARLTDELRPAFETATAPAKQAKIERKQRREAQATAAEAVAAMEHAQEAATAAQGAERAAVEALRAERQAHAAQMRDIPLEAVLKAAGWDPDPHDKKQWRGPLGAGRLSLDGSKWFDHDAGKGGGKAIDLAKHLNGADFEGALGWLGAHFGAAGAAQALHARAAEPPPPKAPFLAPKPAPEHWPRVREYLTRVRKLPAQLVDWVANRGTLYADERANAVFLAENSAGEPVLAEKRGTNPEKRFVGLEKGSDRNVGGFSVLRNGFEAPPKSPAAAVFVAESAIDALSASELVSVTPGERWIFASTAGARGDAPWLKRLVETGKRLIVAFDSDQVGEAAAAEMLKNYPGAERMRPPPGSKDWNAALQSREEMPPGEEQDWGHAPGG